ncbi:MAG: rod shape-determining protein RodA [Atopobiaceae bacterium]|nr:rod shape-determining protein RodA [Atopobiaceae bacterium]
MPVSDLGSAQAQMHMAASPRRDDASQVQRRPKTSLAQSFYLPQLVPALLLIAYGAVVIWSASLNIYAANFPRHMIGIVLGLGTAWFIRNYDYRAFTNMSTALFIFDCLLMISPRIPGLGVFGMGMTGWVRIPFIRLTFQPSEVAKIVTIFLMASLGAQYNGKIESLREYVKLCAILTVPFLLILLQPDLGTGLIVLVTGASIIIVSGARRSWVLVTIGLIVLVATLAIVTSMTPGLPHILKEYQLNRLIVFVDPSVDPGGSGYNLQQSKIAVGSGGLFGKGIGNASQSGTGFLPEAHTDFVFALLSEEFGFVGSISLLALFGWMIFAAIELAQRLEQPFGKLVLAGIVTMWSFQVLQEVGMCIGIMPITGIPLPVISFGSTSMVAQCMAIGVVQSVWHFRTKAA